MSKAEAPAIIILETTSIAVQTRDLVPRALLQALSLVSMPDTLKRLLVLDTYPALLASVQVARAVLQAPRLVSVPDTLKAPARSAILVSQC